MTQTVEQWALVTGASSGLGAALATALAARRFHLVLAARREAPMRDLAAQLARRYAIEAVVEAIDLAAPDSAAALVRRLDARGVAPDVLVNNAAVGLSGPLVDQDSDRLRAMLHLNVITFTELARLIGGRMAERGGGHLLLVASMAAYQPTPLLAAYGAAKAYVLSLGEALHVELAPAVGVTVLSPGLMDTGFADAAGYQPPPSARRTMLAPAAVAEIGVDAMLAGRPSVVAGRLNRLAALGSRLLSRHRQAEFVFRTAVR